MNTFLKWMVDDFNFMMKKKRNAILLASTTNSLSVSVETVFYIVKKGDTLSNILYKKNVKPIYGKRGQLVEVLKLNPEIKKDNGNKIYPGMKIAFSFEENSAKIVSTDNRQQTTDNRQQTTDNRQQTTDNLAA